MSWYLRDFLSVCPWSLLAVKPSIRPSIHLSSCRSVHCSNQLSVLLSVLQSPYLFVYPPVRCPSIYPSIRLSIHLSLLRVSIPFVVFPLPSPPFVFSSCPLPLFDVLPVSSSFIYLSIVQGDSLQGNTSHKNKVPSNSFSYTHSFLPTVFSFPLHIFVYMLFYAVCLPYRWWLPACTLSSYCHIPFGLFIPTLPLYTFKQPQSNSLHPFKYSLPCKGKGKCCNCWGVTLLTVKVGSSLIYWWCVSAFTHWSCRPVQSRGVNSWPHPNTLCSLFWTRKILQPK